MADIYTIKGTELAPDPFDPSQDANIACPVEALAANGYRWVSGSCDASTSDLHGCSIALFRHRLHGFFLDIKDMHGERIIAFKAGNAVHLLTVLEKAAPLLHLLALDQRYCIHVANEVAAAYPRRAA